MNDTTKIDLELAPGPLPDELSAMTFPAYRHLLDMRPRPRHPELGEVEPIQPFAIVARQDGRLVGLALAETPLAETPVTTIPEATALPPQLLSVFVRPEARRRGVATALVAAVEAEVRARGLGQLAAVYTTGKPGIEWMEQIFARRGWDPPERASLSVRIETKRALTWNGFEERRVRALGRGLEIFPWAELTDAENEEIQRSNGERRWIEPSLEPWPHDRSQLDSSSVGARYQGKVVGWVLNHRILPGVVRFSVSFMRRDLSRRGRIVPLYHASFLRVDAQGCHLCTFITPFSYPRMIEFIERWLTSVASFVGESRRARLEL